MKKLPKPMTGTVKKMIVPTEAQEQEALFEWIERFGTVDYPDLDLMFHITNEGLRSPAMGARLKKQGLKKGVPDLLLPIPRGVYAGLFIEMKRIGGKPTPHQKQWIKRLTEQGYKAVVCEGWIKARDTIMDYMDGVG